MQKVRNKFLIICCLVLTICCCSFLTACESSKTPKSLAVNKTEITTPAYDVTKHSSMTEYKKTIINDLIVTVTYTDGSTETFTGWDEMSKNGVYFHNFNLVEAGEYEVSVIYQSVSATIKLTVT